MVKQGHPKIELAYHKDGRLTKEKMTHNQINTPSVSRGAMVGEDTLTHGSQNQLSLFWHADR